MILEIAILVALIAIVLMSRGLFRQLEYMRKRLSRLENPSSAADEAVHQLPPSRNFALGKRFFYSLTQSEDQDSAEK